MRRAKDLDAHLFGGRTAGAARWVGGGLHTVGGGLQKGTEPLVAAAAATKGAMLQPMAAADARLHLRSSAATLGTTVRGNAAGATAFAGSLGESLIDATSGVAGAAAGAASAIGVVALGAGGAAAGLTMRGLGGAREAAGSGSTMLDDRLHLLERTAPARERTSQLAGAAVGVVIEGGRLVDIRLRKSDRFNAARVRPATRRRMATPGF